MREWINLFENKKHDSDYIIDYVADLNDREDPYEGDLPKMIAEYDDYYLELFPIDGLQLKDFRFDQDLAKDYAALNTPAPPIVIGEDGFIFDGCEYPVSAGERNILSVLDARFAFHPAFISVINEPALSIKALKIGLFENVSGSSPRRKRRFQDQDRTITICRICDDR